MLNQRIFAALTALTIAGVAPATADTASLKIRIEPEQIFVASKAGAYTGMTTTGDLTIHAHIKANIPGVPRVTEWWLMPKIRRMYLRQAVLRDTSKYGHHKKYTFLKRPDRIDRNLTMSIPLSRLKGSAETMCRARAEELKRAGLSEADIYSKDRKALFRIEVSFDGESLGPASRGRFGDDDQRELTVVCMKSPPPRAGSGANGRPTAEPPGPVSVPGGPIKITGVTTSLRPLRMRSKCGVRATTSFESARRNTPFTYRYVLKTNTQTIQSTILSAKTDGEGKFLDIRTFDIPQVGGLEVGHIQAIVGQPNLLGGNKATYQLSCGL